MLSTLTEAKKSFLLMEKTVPVISLELKITLFDVFDSYRRIHRRPVQSQQN
jgi:hypothetical protein